MALAPAGPSVLPLVSKKQLAVAIALRLVPADANQAPRNNLNVSILHKLPDMKCLRVHSPALYEAGKRTTNSEVETPPDKLINTTR